MLTKLKRENPPFSVRKTPLQHAHSCAALHSNVANGTPRGTVLDARRAPCLRNLPGRDRGQGVPALV